MGRRKREGAEGQFRYETRRQTPSSPYPSPSLSKSRPFLCDGRRCERILKNPNFCLQNTLISISAFQNLPLTTVLSLSLSVWPFHRGGKKKKKKKLQERRELKGGGPEGVWKLYKVSICDLSEIKLVRDQATILQFREPLVIITHHCLLAALAAREKKQIERDTGNSFYHHHHLLILQKKKAMRVS